MKERDEGRSEGVKDKVTIFVILPVLISKAVSARLRDLFTVWYHCVCLSVCLFIRLSICMNVT